MTYFKKFKNLKYVLAAGLTTSLMGIKSAHSAELDTTITEITDNLGSVPTLFTSASYIFGVGFTIAGLFKLKEYVDDPSSGAMKDALIRLGIGAGLILLPFVISTASGTIGGDQASGNFQRADMDTW